MKRTWFKYALAAGLGAAVLACANKQAKDDQGSGNAQGAKQFRGGRNGGGFAQMGAGFSVALTLNGVAGATPAAQPTVATTSSQSAASEFKVDVSGFSISCATEATAQQGTIELSMSLQKGSPAVTYTTTTTVPTSCYGATTVTVSPLEVGSVSTLDVTLKDASGNAYAKGTAAAFTQAAMVVPTPDPNAQGGGPGGGPGGPGGFQRPTPEVVSITMNPVGSATPTPAATATPSPTATPTSH